MTLFSNILDENTARFIPSVCLWKTACHQCVWIVSKAQFNRNQFWREIENANERDTIKFKDPLRLFFALVLPSF